MSGREKGQGGKGKFQGKFSVSGPSFSGPTKINTNKNSKNSINDWNYYFGSTKQASEYEATTKFLINYIKQNFEFGNDIEMAIINQELSATKIWKPTLQVSRNPDQEIKKMENEQFKIKFKEDYDHYCIREQTYLNNGTKAYALFWNRCAKGMKNKIESRSDFKDKIENNPFKLLQAIKDHYLNYQEKKYNMSVILDSLKTLINTKQKEKKSLQNSTKRF
jgi:hypothetical protein